MYENAKLNHYSLVKLTDNTILFVLYLYLYLYLYLKGRGVDNDLILQEMSVSRMHGYLHLKSGQLFLEDNYSKFGTLVLLP